jgi:hypothetical protein
MSVFKKALTLLVGDTSDFSYLKLPKNHSTLSRLSERELIQRESEIGRELFGPIPKGHQREFFCLDEQTCIWYEAYKDENGKDVELTTRYEIQGDRVLKAQPGGNYSYIEGPELDNLLTAIGMYYERVMRSIYHSDPRTGQSLTS